MGFSRRKKSNRLINGSTMIVPGSDNLSMGAIRSDNSNIIKFSNIRPTPQPSQNPRQAPNIGPPTPTPSSSGILPTPTPTPTPSSTATVTPTVTPTPTITPTPSQLPLTLYFGNAPLSSITGDNVFSGTSLITFLATFSGSTNNSGQLPYGSITEYNNLIYGITTGGGTPGNSSGDIYHFNPQTNIIDQQAVFSQTSGCSPYQGMTFASDSNFYGTTTACGLGTGSLYRFDPVSLSITYLHLFSGSGAFPGQLIEYNNILYGTTYTTGANNKGYFYSYNISTSAFTIILDYDGTNGENPYLEGLVYDSGYIYGTTQGGGSNFFGTLFRYDTNTNNYNIIYNFTTTSGGGTTGIIKLYNNKIFGFCSYSTSNAAGKAFYYDLVTSGITFFANLDNDTQYGAQGEMVIIDNNIFALFPGGQLNNGTLSKIDITNGNIEVIYGFGGFYSTINGLTYYDGKIYGTTPTGGGSNNGQIFSLEYSEPMSSITSFNYSQTFTFPSCDPAQYQYIVIPQSLGTPSSFIDQLSNPVAMESPYTTTVQSVVCNVYRTTNAITSGITITVS